MLWEGAVNNGLADVGMLNLNQLPYRYAILPLLMIIAACGSQKTGHEFRDCDECPEMVVIPAGSFTMGSPGSEGGRQKNEGPQRTIQIEYEFAVGKYEVTWAEWEACVAHGSCSNSGPDSQGGDEGWGKGFRPVINVNWQDAQDYVQWLSRKTGQQYRLLSEAEWEYVARAGTSTRFYFGDTITPDKANYNGKLSYYSEPADNSHKKTMPTGSYPPNAFGVHDMHGNVFEWTQDCYGYYGRAPTDGSAHILSDCPKRSIRGGSWIGGAMFSRSAFRAGSEQQNRNRNWGFRVARTL